MSMDTIHVLIRRSMPKLNIKETLLGARQAYKTQKQVKEVKNTFNTLNNTIHQAAPFVEYAFEKISEKLAKRKESTTQSSTFIVESTYFLIRSTEKSLIDNPSNFKDYSNKKSKFYENTFNKKSWSSQKIFLGLIALGIIFIFITLLSIRLFINKTNNNQIYYNDQEEILEDDLSRNSIDSTTSTSLD